MNYLIIEDERASADLLISTMAAIGSEYRLLAVLATIEDSAAWLTENNAPDIIFMDIRLEDGLSFEIFKHVSITAPVIFITAYDQYALQAFKVYGAAYLLKPIAEDELKEALRRLGSKKPAMAASDMSMMLKAISEQKVSYKQRFLIPYREEYKIVNVSSIDYIFLELKTVHLVLLSGDKIAVNYSLDELEDMLDPALFFRANRQFIITAQSIDKVQKYFNEKTKIILKRNASLEVIVSRIRTSAFKHWLTRG